MGGDLVSFLANTTISIKRGTYTDDYGDETDSDEVVASGIGASILERPVTGGRPASGRKDTTRTYALRVWKPIDLRQDDRVVNERTKEVYVVTTLAPSTNNVGLGSTRADLQRVT
jgi:hypothetical protein